MEVATLVWGALGPIERADEVEGRVVDEIDGDVLGLVILAVWLERVRSRCDVANERNAPWISLFTLRSLASMFEVRH